MFPTATYLSAVAFCLPLKSNRKCILKVGLDTPELLRAQAAKPAAPVFLCFSTYCDTFPTLIFGQKVKLQMFTAGNKVSNETDTAHISLLSRCHLPFLGCEYRLLQR